LHARATYFSRVIDDRVTLASRHDPKTKNRDATRSRASKFAMHGEQ
jgi:hypothetical protein